MTDEVGAIATVTTVTVDQQVKVDHKLPFTIKVFEGDAEVVLDEKPLITLSDDTPAAVTDNPDGGYFFVPNDDSVGAIVQLRAKVGSGDDATFGTVTIEIVAADVVTPPVTRTISFVFGEPVPK